MMTQACRQESNIKKKYCRKKYNDDNGPTNLNDSCTSVAHGIRIAVEDKKKND